MRSRHLCSCSRRQPPSPLISSPCPAKERTLNGPQQPSLPGSIGNTNSIEGEFGNIECHNHEMQKSQQSGDTTSQKENLSLKCFGGHIENIDGDHVPSGLLEPAASCRSRHTMSNGEVKVTGGLDQTTKSMIVLFLDSAVFRHAENGPARSTSHSGIAEEHRLPRLRCHRRQRAEGSWH
jgi:hypothetical protein